VLLLLELHLGGRTNLDDRNPTGQLGQALLQLLGIPVGIRVSDLPLDLLDPALDVRFGPAAFDDGGVRPW
jgi:hypothetical protein